MISVGIVILNYNGNSDTLDCLMSLEKFLLSEKYSFKLYLLDNASREPLDQPDLSVFKLPINYTKNDINYGFAQGNNIGMLQAMEEGSKYVMLLNNDTLLTDYSIQNTLNYMEQHTNIGIAGLVNYYFDEPSNIWQDGFHSDLVNGISKVVDRNQGPMSDFYEADYLPGSSMIIKREVIENIGYLNSDFFAYYEDIDFCLRSKANGYQVGFNPNSKLLHKVSKSSTSYIRLYLRTRNKLLFYSKYSTAKNFKKIYKKLLWQSAKRAAKALLQQQNYLIFKSYLFAFKDFHGNQFNQGSLSRLK